MGTLSIEKAALTITANDQTYTYNGSAQGEDNATYTNNSKVTVTGLKGTDALTSVTLDGQETNAGTYEEKIVPSAAEIGEVTDNYEISYVAGKLIIDKAKLTVTANDQTYTYNAAAQGENNATYTDASKVTVEGLQGDDALTSVTLNGQETNAGEYADKIVPSAAEIGTATGNYDISYVAGKLTIEKAALTITANDQTYTYNGNPQGEGDTAYEDPAEIAEKVTVEGLQGSDALTSVKLGGQETNAGEYADKIVPSAAAIGMATANYDITYVAGTLTINKLAITVTADTKSKVYDNDASTDPALTATVEGAVDGDNVNYTVTREEGQDAGEYTITVNPGDNPNYEIAPATGTFTITPRPVTLTSATDSKVYDGTALTNDTVTVTSELGFVEGQGATYDVTGTQTLVGESANAFTYTLNEGTKADNYQIQTVPGTLTVTDGTNPDDPKPVDDNLVITKTAEDKEYASGETVEFTITVTNIYSEAKTIEITEIEGVALDQPVITDVAAGATTTAKATYTITEADLLNGSFTNTATAKVGNITKTATATVETVDVDTTMTVTKTITNKPANGTAYTLGEIIEYLITVTNDGNVTFYNVVVEDALVNFVETIGSLGAGLSQTFNVSYTITEADILAGKVSNTVTAEGNPITDPKTGDELTPAGEATVETGNADDPDNPNPPIEEKNPHLTVTKTSNVAEGETVSLGQTITYTITVENDGNLTVSGITLTDEVAGYEAADITANLDKTTLAPGETATATFTHVVTEQDILAGSVANTATADGDNPSDDPTGNTPGTKEDPTDALDVTLTVDKKITNQGGSSTGAFFVGQAIEYAIDVTNNGNATYNNIVVTDQIDGDITINAVSGYTVNSDGTVSIASLAPAGKVTITASHVVTEADVIAGEVANTATAKADPIPDPNGGSKTPEGSDTVTTGDADDPNGPTPPVADPNPVIEMTKVVTSAPANGATYGAGETITWNVVVANQGNLSLTNVQVSDQLTGATGGAVVIQPGDGYTVNGSIATIASLPATGANTIVIPVSYTVSVTDAGATITNGAVATAANPADPTTPVTDQATSDPTPVTSAPTPVPTPAAPVAPAAATPIVPAAAGAVAPTPAAPAVTPIVDNPAPQVETVADDGNALGDGGAWSLFDLICTILTTILAAIMLIGALGRNRKEGDDEEEAAAKRANGEEVDYEEVYKRKRIGRILSIVPAIGAIVLFILTQDLTQPMIIFDIWSLVFAIIAIINIVLAIVTRKKTDDDEDEEQQTGYAPAGA